MRAAATSNVAVMINGRDCCTKDDFNTKARDVGGGTG